MLCTKTSSELRININFRSGPIQMANFWRKLWDFSNLMRRAMSSSAFVVSDGEINFGKKTSAETRERVLIRRVCTIRLCTATRWPDNSIKIREGIPSALPKDERVRVRGSLLVRPGVRAGRERNETKTRLSGNRRDKRKTKKKQRICRRGDRESAGHSVLRILHTHTHTHYLHGIKRCTIDVKIRICDF